VAHKIFNRVFNIINADNKTLTIINGDNITRLEILESENQVIIYMCDGNTYTLSGQGATQVTKAIKADMGKGEDS